MIASLKRSITTVSTRATSFFNAPAIAAILVVGMFALFVGTGLRGIDFGLHWDERPSILDLVSKVLSTHKPLPGYYNYPSFPFDLSLSAILPDAIQGVVHRQANRDAGLAQISRLDSYLLRVRSLFLIVAALAIIWIYLLLLGWRKNHIEALVGAAFLAGSWEVAYHARWVAPDAIMMQFAALTIFCTVYAQYAKRPIVWLCLAAVAGGAAFSTKYPGALLFLPVAISAIVSLRKSQSLRNQLAILIGLGVLFAVTFVVITPGSVLDFKTFISDVRFEANHYATGHFGYTIVAGLPAFLDNLQYLALVAFSRYSIIALCVFLLACLGAIAVILEDRKIALILLSFPVIYLLYFSIQRVMIVRNLLVLFPFLAILAARGVGFLQSRLSAQWFLRPVLPIAILVIILINGNWLIFAANTIANEKTVDVNQEIVDYVRQHPDDQFICSFRVQKQLGAQRSLCPTGKMVNVGNTWILMYGTELMDAVHEQQIADVRGGYDQLGAGPYDVNWDYYPTWVGYDRVIVIRGTLGAQMGLLDSF